MGTQKFVVLALASALASAGCVTTRTGAWATPTSAAIPVTPAAQSQAELVSRGEVEWAARGSEPHALAAVEAWSRALEAAPTDAVLWARLARAQYFYADAYLTPDPGRAAQATVMYEAAMSSAERAILARVPEIGDELRSGRSFTSILSRLDEHDVPGMYWRTLAMNRWARGFGMFTLNAVRDEMRATMGRVTELERGYDGYGADRFLGESWAGASAIQGGDLERARQHFEYAIYAAPEMAASHVAFALTVGVKTQDRTLFETQLEAALSMDPGGPDLAPENAVEQRRARQALDREYQLLPR